MPYDCIEKGRFTFQYLADTDAAKYDIRLGHMGETMQFEVISPKACEELDKLIPHVVDRYNGKFGIQFVRAFGETSALRRTDDHYKKVRSVLTKLLGFNHASRYIPIVLDCIEEKVKGWKEGETIEALEEMCNVVLKIIIKIIFGKDINDEVEHMNYHTKDGKVVEMDFYTFFPQVMRDLLDAEIHYINIVFPVLFKNGWCYPNNVNEKNIIELRSKLKNFLGMRFIHVGTYYVQTLHIISILNVLNNIL